MDPSADTSVTASDATPGTDGDASEPEPRRRGGLDRRTLGICVCIALVGAIVAALVASALIGDDDDGSDRAESDPSIQIVETVDVASLLEVELLTVDDEPTTLATYRSLAGDQPMVINLWAQNCVPCVDEMPLLEAAHQANPDLTFLGVDTLDQPAKAKVMAEQTGITYPWVQDRNGDFFYEAKAAGMPTTFILMPSGEVVASKTGAFDSQAELQGWLDDHVA